MKKSLIILTVIIIILTILAIKFGGVVSNVVLKNAWVKGDNFCGRSSFAYCETDEQCVPSGCGFQLCGVYSEAPKTLPKNCEEKSCFNATKYDKECVCYKKLCQWRAS